MADGTSVSVGPKIGRLSLANWKYSGKSTGTGVTLTSGTLDLKGIVLANVLTPVVGAGVVTMDQVTSYFAATGRTNQIIQTSDLASLLLNVSNFNLTAPGFLPQGGSSLLTGAVTGEN